jgi:ssDNA-binding replication factor A large subunit
MADNYLQLVERISKAAGLAVEELERKIDAKRAKLSGLVSKEGAAQIVAAELGVNFDKERMKISELVHGMKRANVLGKVLSISPVRVYQKGEREGKVCNLFVADESSNAKVVLWDTNHIFLVESGKIKIGDNVEISNGNVRNGEIHLSSFSDIKLSNEKIGDVIVSKIFESGKISDAKAGQSLKTRAVIVQVFEPRYFEVCPECGKRAFEAECKIHGKIEPKKRALMNIVLDDGSETIRSVLFGAQINKLGLSDEEIFSLEKFNEVKNKFFGEEKYFLGNVRNNALYNTNEFNIEQIEEVNADALIKELEVKTQAV